MLSPDGAQILRNQCTIMDALLVLLDAATPLDLKNEVRRQLRARIQESAEQMRERA